MIWLRCLIFLGFGFSWVFADTTTIRTPENGSKKVYDWPKECNGGQGYWCQNLNTAHDCNALPHCAQAVWQNQLMTIKDDSPACESCVRYITEFQDFSTKNMTVEQLEIALELVCDFIPQSLIAKECGLAVRKITPDVEHYIKSIKPHTFCSTIFLCNAATSNKKYLESKNIPIPKDETKTKESKAANSEIKPKSETTISDNSKDLSPSVKSPQEFNCSSCYILLATSNKMVKHSSRDDILNRMIEICGKMSSFSDICSTNVITHFNEIYNFLLKLNPEEGCHLAGVCNNIYHIHGLTEDLKSAVDRAPEEANDEVCDFCVAMVKHLKDIVISKSSEQEFKLVLLNICKQTGSFEEECTQLVNQYYTLIYQFLVEELQGDELCKDIKLCNSKIQGIDEEVPLWPLVPSELNLDELIKNETKASDSKPAIHSVQLTKTLTEFSKPLHLVGDSRCTWGPSYWCTNMATSKECPGTLKHCIHEVWEKQVLPADNGDICKICKDMVQQARDQLLSNETQAKKLTQKQKEDELRQVFEGSCALIPVKVAKKECVKVVDNFVPELVEALSSQMNPQVVCATVGLCNSAKMDLLLQKEKLEKSDEELNMPLLPLPIDRMFPEFIQNQPLKAEIEKRGKEACELCELLLHYVQQQITLPKSEQEIKKVIDQVCVKLPDRVANKCSEFILEYGDDFISLLAQQIDPSTVCPSIGACPAFLTFVDNVKPTCPLCLLAVEAAENKLTNNKTEASVIKAFDNLCDDLPQNMQPACKTFIKDSLDKLVDSLMADFSSQETCYYLHLCGTDVGHESVSIDISKEGSVPSIVTNDVHPAVVKGDDQKCILCEFIISKLEKELQDNKTEAEIRHAFNTVCNHMPKTTVVECKKFVTRYLDLILDLITQSVGPKEICTELHVCDKELLSTVVESLITKCEVCEALIGSLQGVTTDPHVEDDIFHKVLLGCNRLPKTYHNMCRDLVFQLEPQIAAIIHMVPSSYVCTRLGICHYRRSQVDLVISGNCSEGPKFWCSSTTNAASCGTTAIEYCQQKVWKASKPRHSFVIEA